jgi:hypothetical protein
MTVGLAIEAHAAASLVMADIIDDHAFSLRQRLALGLVRRLSFGAGRTEAPIPNLRHWTAALRISRGNVCAVLGELQRRLVLEEAAQGFWGFVLPWEMWKVPRRTESIEVINQLSLLEAPPHLRSALRQTFLEQCQGKHPAAAGALPSRDASAVPAPLPDLGTPVPESGTGRPYPNREHPPDPSPPGTYRAVPESGTPNVTLQQCKNASSKKQICNVAMQVPDSGTAPRLRGSAGALTEDQQRLFDQLREAGAFGPAMESRGCWFGMVRDRFEVTRELLSELQYARLSRYIEKPGAWMMDKWIRWGKPTR